MNNLNGKVYIGSMNMRGKWAPLPCNSKRINVTSAQSKKSKYRLAFSPMTPIKGGYKGYYCFENYWQSGKRYEGIDDITVTSWWKKQEKGRRKYPKGKGKTIKYAEFPEINETLDYIPSRKLVYVPEYHNLIYNLPLIKKLKKDVSNGVSYAIYDFDGPRTFDGNPTIKEVTLEFLKEMINNPKYPFGHGYIIAALISGINIEYFINDDLIS